MRATCSVCGVALHVPAKALRRQAYDATCSANIPGSTESRVDNAASQYTCAADVRVPRNSRPTQHHKTCQPSGAKLQSLHRHILVSTCVSARAHGSHAAKSGERVPAPHGAPRPATARTSCLCPCPPTRHRKQMVLFCSSSSSSSSSPVPHEPAVTHYDYQQTEALQRGLTCAGQPFVGPAWLRCATTAPCDIAAAAALVLTETYWPQPSFQNCTPPS